MTGTPAIKIYRNGEYIAACKHPEDAAAICGMTPGTEARLGHAKHATIFVEPETLREWSAANSRDQAAEIMEANIGRIRAGRRPMTEARDIEAGIY